MPFQEKDMQSLFTKYIKQNYPHSAVFELKISKTKSLAFKRVEPHQITALKKAKHTCVYHKISDFSPEAKPFDAFQVCNTPAFLVILFYKPRKPKTTYWIDIDDWYFHTKISLKKSITEDEVKALASNTHLL